MNMFGSRGPKAKTGIKQRSVTSVGGNGLTASRAYQQSKIDAAQPPALVVEPKSILDSQGQFKITRSSPNRVNLHEFAAARAARGRQGN